MSDLDSVMEAVPVAQLGDVFRHLGPLLDKSSLKVLAPLMPSQDSQPSKRSKGAPPPSGKGKGKGKGKKRTKDEEVDLQEALQTMGRLVLRLDLQMRQSNLNCCLIFFINNREESILPSMVQTTATWKQMAEQGQTTKSLRSTLWELILSSLLQRVHLLAKAKEGDPMWTKALNVGLLMPDGSWPFQEWNHHQRQLVQAKTPPRKMEAILANLTALEESSRDPSLVTSFHTMKPLGKLDLKTDAASKDLEVYPWRLQLNPREDDPWNTLLQLQGNAVWHLIGLRYKQANLKQSALASTLESQLHALR
eukprot:s4641_g5.t1